MLPTSQKALIEPQLYPSEAASLAEAFSNFIGASSRLENSYRDLQAEVVELSQALSERNRALSESRSETAAMANQLQCILENIPCGVFVMGEDGSIRLANPEATRLLRLSGAQLLPAETLMAKPGLQLELQSLVADEEVEQEISFERNGIRIWMAVRRVGLPFREAVPKGTADAVFTLRDISARKRMEEEREAARDAVALAQVSAVLAHEIRNPLASLELFAGLAEEDPERRPEWLSHLRAGIRSLSGTVNNVLTLHGSSPLLLEPVEALAEAALAVQFLQPLAMQAGVSLEFFTGDVPAGLRVNGNRGGFHQVLMNLCSNALRHTPAGGTVEVRCEECYTPAGGLRVAVTDTGCGIPDDHLPHLFEVGFSGSGVSSGLGLAVCARLLHQMGGTLAVQSRVGHGSTFTLELLGA